MCPADLNFSFITLYYRIQSRQCFFRFIVSASYLSYANLASIFFSLSFHVWFFKDRIKKINTLLPSRTRFRGMSDCDRKWIIKTRRRCRMQPPFCETHNMIYLKDCCFKVSLKFVFSRHFTLTGPIISITVFPLLSASPLLFCCYLTYCILFLRNKLTFALLSSQLLQFKRMSRAGWLWCFSDIAAFTWYPQHSDINKHHAGFDQACLLEASPVTLNSSSIGVLHELLTLSLVVFILGQQVLLYTQQCLFQRAPIWQIRKKIFAPLQFGLDSRWACFISKQLLTILGQPFC